MNAARVQVAICLTAILGTGAVVALYPMASVWRNPGGLAPIWMPLVVSVALCFLLSLYLLGRGRPSFRAPAIVLIVVQGFLFYRLLTYAAAVR